MKPWLCLLMAAMALPLCAREKKPTGDIPNLNTFGKVRSYCVDTSDLPGWEALDVRNLIETESKPKGLLSKLPWRLVADCMSQPDAVVRFKFPRVDVVRLQIGARPPASEDPQQPSPVRYEVRARLQVSDSRSSRLLYEVEAGPVNYTSGHTVAPVEEPDHILRRESAYHAFWTLIDDVKRTAGHRPKTPVGASKIGPSRNSETSP